MVAYKSFCWCLGTTSFRTKNFNKTIEEQLKLLNDFWQIPKNNKNWINNKTIQTDYYDFMKEKGFVAGDAKRKDKDAREKTSGLVDIGLIDDNRRLTCAGNALLEISNSGDFSPDNVFQIPKDSFIYLKQLLKTSNNVGSGTVRPFIILLYLLAKFESLTFEEYTYLLPLCISQKATDYIVDKIYQYRNKQVNIDDIIIENLMSMSNYQESLETFLDNDLSEDLICEIGMNRKSRTYDKFYYPLYKAIYQAYINKTSNFIDIYEATKKIRIGSYWRKYIFNTSSTKTIVEQPQHSLNKTLFDSVKDEMQLKEAFFKIMHLMKAKATLSDYLDLNRRYIKTTDIVLFNDETIKLDIVPKHFFNSIINDLYSKAFESSTKLFDNCKLEEISSCLITNEDTIIASVNDELGTTVSTVSQAKNILENERYKRFQLLIDEKFTDEKLISLLELFENRNDDQIREIVTDNADVPTIFEYILGIIWYKISEEKGNILDYMKLSLDSNLLPKTHAAGGEADIVYEYSKTPYYPEHVLLLEATLTDGNNQRRMEMEPVSRHLGMHLIKNNNKNSYCVFITTYLDINVIADFRSRKNSAYYDPQNFSKFVPGMKIIPLKTEALKNILRTHKTYNTLYSIFEELHDLSLPPYEWYNVLSARCCNAD